jgi:hypothetical protein
LERGWRYIEPIFGEFHPATISFEDLDAFYSAVLRKNGVGEAYRALKTWRACTS